MLPEVPDASNVPETVSFTEVAVNFTIAPGLTVSFVPAATVTVECDRSLWRPQ